MHVSVPGPPLVGVPARIARVTTVVESVATVLPLASATRTVGCVGNGAPPVAVGGVVLQGNDAPQQTRSVVAGPEVTSKVAPTAGESPGDEAVRW